MSLTVLPHSNLTRIIYAGLLSAHCWLLAPLALPAESALELRVRPLIEGHQGKVALAIKHLPSGESLTINADEPMPTASLIKVAVMIEAYQRADRGELNLNRMLTLTEADKVPGSGILTPHFSEGAQVSVRDAIRLMMAYSDNTATNLVIDQLGLEAISRCMDQLSCPNTRMHAKVFRGDTSIAPERSRQFGLGSTTAAEMLSLLERLWNGELASAESTAAMLDHLRACESQNRLPRLLPRGTRVAQKTGSVTAVRTDAGIIETPSGPFVIVFLTAENKDQRWSNENSAELLAGVLARAAYDHFHPSTTSPATPPVDDSRELTVGAAGWLVEALQRTLNQRLDPSPQLNVDGEFGPVTEAAVKQLQQSRHLEVTGVVDSATWQALGPLATAPDDITDPSLVPQQLPERAPADALEGPPFVTAPGWIVGDAETAEVLWGTEVDTPRPNASTTKLLTALVALREARRDPALWDEWVTFSPRADATPGSTAEIRAGEKVKFRDLMYGLLLPSGNDASIAIAEHLGARFSPAPGEAEASLGATPEDDHRDRQNSERIDLVERFVAEMNRVAAEIGMTNSSFRNPHGLSASRHQASPRDLFRLAVVLHREKEILPFVSTQRHVARLESTSGYSRYQVWTNTNRLLAIDGYLGMKTGTTTAAGACLVSLGERDGRRLIVVVLGSAASESRYADTRNLFRWSWQQLRPRELISKD